MKQFEQKKAEQLEYEFDFTEIMSGTPTTFTFTLPSGVTKVSHVASGRTIVAIFVFGEGTLAGGRYRILCQAESGDQRPILEMEVELAP